MEIVCGRTVMRLPDMCLILVMKILSYDNTAHIYWIKNVYFRHQDYTLQIFYEYY